MLAGFTWVLQGSGAKREQQKRPKPKEWLYGFRRRNQNFIGSGSPGKSLRIFGVTPGRLSNRRPPDRILALYWATLGLWNENTLGRVFQRLAGLPSKLSEVTPALQVTRRVSADARAYRALAPKIVRPLKFWFLSLRLRLCFGLRQRGSGLRPGLFMARLQRAPFRSLPRPYHPNAA